MAALRHGWPIAFAMLWTAPLVGCRSNGHCEMLELEQQMLENQLYELEHSLEDRETELASANERIDSLEADLGGNGKSAPKRDDSRQKLFPRRDRGDRKSRGPATEPIEELQIEPGVETSPSSSSRLPVPSTNGTPARLSSTAALRRRTPAGPVQTVAILADKSGALAPRDGREAGVALALEPRDAAGQAVETAGAVTIAAIDPSVEGAAGRVARWDFTAEAVAAQFVKGPQGPTIQFELPWPGPPPVNPSLVLHVRFVTADGRKLYADTPMSLVPVDRQARREVSQWTGPSREPQQRDQSTASVRNSAPPTEKRPAWKPYR